MPRTLSAKAKAQKTEMLRQEFPYLEELLDAFRDNGFKSEDVMAIINDSKAGTPMPGAVAEKFSMLEDEQKARVNAAAESLCDAYAEFFEQRRQSGVELKAQDALEGLAGDIYKICNFNHGTPYHKARQGMEGYLRAQAKGAEVETDGVDVDVDAPQQEGDTPQHEGDTPPAEDTPQHEGDTPPAEEKDPPKEQPKTKLDKDDALKLGAAAGAVTGLVAAGEAAKSWRERIKKPEAKKKALAFASVAAVSAVGVAASLFLGRNSGVSR